MLAALLTSASRRADAQLPRRSWGIGTVFGGGISYNVVPSLMPPAVAFGAQADLGTLELRFFVTERYSIDVYSQLGNTLLSSISAALPRQPSEPGSLIFASLGVLWAFHIPFASGAHSVIVAAGLEVGGDVGVGGLYEMTHPVKFAFRVPMRVGVELLLRSRAVGFQFLARPFLEAYGYARQGGRDIVSPGFGVLAEVGVMFYR